MKFHQWIIALCLASSSASALAKVKVLTTTSDLNALVGEIGGSEVESESICKGSQDPHFIEPKPSFMVKASRADLVVAVGMGLEVGWLPNVLRGSRNPNINPGTKGYLEVGTSVQPLEVPQGKVTRAEGDVHPEGNPHVTLDPIRAGEIAVLIGKRLGELDAANAAKYLAGEAGFRACEQAVMTHGGFGYAREFHVERYLREIMIPRIAPVSPQLALSFIAEKALGLVKSY